MESICVAVPAHSLQDQWNQEFTPPPTKVNHREDTFKLSKSEGFIKIHSHDIK